MSSPEEQRHTKNENESADGNDNSNSGNPVNVASEQQQKDLPPNRFELELEFLQALASPAYLHFLATSRVEDGRDILLVNDPAFRAYLKYLRTTWSQPAYARFLVYPHALYFLDLLLEKPAVLKEWTLPGFRNFCHQQQFLSWQHRHATLYGRGTAETTAAATADGAARLP